MRWFLSLLTLSILPVDGYQQYVARLPNGDKVPNVPAIGHVNPNGGSGGVNSFGQAFDSMNKWTLSLCLTDSDGDGQTNGQELGDPCCTWVKGGADPHRTTGITDPGNAAKKTSDANLNVDCTNATQITNGATASHSPPSVMAAMLTMLIAMQLV